VRRVQASGSVLVEDAQGAAPSLPFWLGEAPARTAELSHGVAELRETVSSLTRGVAHGATRETSLEISNAVSWLKAECCVDDAGSEQIVD
jgi:ATP-dependent Lhr-like helicase